MLVGGLFLILTVLFISRIKSGVQTASEGLCLTVTCHPLVLVVLLLIVNIPYDAYNQGGKWLTNMLQPATVAFCHSFI
ncbi:hypothetical protein BsIDN1_67500 [Bacillus safensis]|uniref:Uncharacterized protein n=1 Tax=Bacillus safensis TaxID=561879 RepID=A0A5S9MKC8_BACIA|nr:hypothetical protein BsIDN1_67500 [Bacillus safensis]